MQAVTRTNVLVRATDPILQNGVCMTLRTRPAVSRLQRHILEPRGLQLAGITTRESEVLRLVASGFSTQEIAEKLCYSQRTVKSILHDVTNRFQLKNRAHAVAYALREGLISDQWAPQIG